MAKVYSIDGVIPVIDPSSFVHPDAVIIGDVIIGKDCYIGPAACLRGDFGRVVIADKVNIQDTCVLHSFPEKAVTVDEGGHIGHGAILHGCHIGKNVLVGMNAVVMDGVVVGDNAFIAAMAFVKAGFTVPPQTLAAGMPAIITRTLDDDEVQWKRQGTEEYRQLAERSLTTMQATAPLTAIDSNRPTVNAGSSKPLHTNKKVIPDPQP